MSERIQKYLARIGIASRREVERMIADGRISVDQKPATPGVAVDSKSKIRIDGNLLKTPSEAPQKTRILMYHKPEGELCTRSDPEGRPTVFENLPKISQGQGRWICVGRLDTNSLGLLLFTNNGELANRLMHPSYEIEREYAVRVMGDVDDQMLRDLSQGIKLEDGLAKFLSIKKTGGDGINQWYHVVLKEGRNREVRRMFEHFDLQVSRLIRVRFGPVDLPRSVPRGRSRDLTFKEQRQLMQAVGLREDPARL